MVIRFETRDARQFRLEAHRRQRHVAQFRRRYRRWSAGKVPLEELCNSAGAALDAYAAESLDALSEANLEESDRTGWITDRYNEGLSSVGTAIREEISDPTARHVVAQVLQERVLRAELRFRDIRDRRRTTSRPL